MHNVIDARSYLMEGWLCGQKDEGEAQQNQFFLTREANCSYVTHNFILYVLPKQTLQPTIKQSIRELYIRSQTFRYTVDVIQCISSRFKGRKRSKFH